MSKAIKKIQCGICNEKYEATRSYWPQEFVTYLNNGVDLRRATSYTFRTGSGTRICRQCFFKQLNGLKIRRWWHHFHCTPQEFAIVEAWLAFSGETEKMADQMKSVGYRSAYVSKTDGITAGDENFSATCLQYQGFKEEFADAEGMSAMTDVEVAMKHDTPLLFDRTTIAILRDAARPDHVERALRDHYKKVNTRKMFPSQIAAHAKAVADAEGWRTTAEGRLWEEFDLSVKGMLWDVHIKVREIQHNSHLRTEYLPFNENRIHFQNQEFGRMLQAQTDMMMALQRVMNYARLLWVDINDWLMVLEEIIDIDDDFKHRGKTLMVTRRVDFLRNEWAPNTVADTRDELWNQFDEDYMRHHNKTATV